MNHRRSGNQSEKRARRFSLIYHIVLIAFCVYTVLQVFVIPHDTMTLAASASDASLASTDLSSQAAAASSGNSGNSVSSAGSDNSESTETSSRNTTSSSENAETSEADEADEADDAGGTSERSNEQGASSAAEESETSKTPTVTTTEDGATVYEADGLTITLTTERVSDTTVYIADIQLEDASRLVSGLADDTFGRNIKETTSSIAQRVGAVLAINGDYYGFRDTGYVIRNGQLYRDTMSSQDAEDLVVYEDGTMAIIEEGQVSAEQLLSDGAVQVYSFGPALTEDSQIVVGENEEVSQSMNSNPRTAIGYISAGHYVMVVSDGRTSESEGLTLYQLAEVMDSLGCTLSYNLDGGGSTTMYFNGQVVNNPTTNGNEIKERSVSDIIYVY